MTKKSAPKKTVHESQPIDLARSFVYWTFADVHFRIVDTASLTNILPSGIRLLSRLPARSVKRQSRMSRILRKILLIQNWRGPDLKRSCQMTSIRSNVPLDGSVLLRQTMHAMVVVWIMIIATFGVFSEQSGNFVATVAGLSEKELVAVVGT
jgi:hypothetical protein